MSTETTKVDDGGRLEECGARTSDEYAAGNCPRCASDSYRHDAENDGLPLTTGGQYDEIGWLLFCGLLITVGVFVGVVLCRVVF